MFRYLVLLFLCLSTPVMACTLETVQVDLNNDGNVDLVTINSCMSSSLNTIPSGGVAIFHLYGKPDFYVDGSVEDQQLGDSYYYTRGKYPVFVLYSGDGVSCPVYVQYDKFSKSLRSMSICY